MIIQESLREGEGETPTLVALSTLRLKDFRNYEEESLLPSRGVNLVVGPNAQGKTRKSL